MEQAGVPFVLVQAGQDESGEIADDDHVRSLALACLVTPAAAA
jgi:hypothetical protein